MIMGLAFWESVFLCHQSENRLKQHKTYNKKWQREGGLESSGQLKILRGDDGGWNEPPLCPPGALWTGRCPTHGIKAVDVVLRKLWWEKLLALDLYGGPESSKRCSLDSHQRHKHWWQPKQGDINSGQQTHLCCIQCFCTWCFISPLQHVFKMLVASIFAQWPLMVLLQTTLPPAPVWKNLNNMNLLNCWQETFKYEQGQLWLFFLFWIVDPRSFWICETFFKLRRAI